MLRHAVRADLAEVIDIWVDAFATDPFFRWIAPEDATYRAFGPDWMTFISELCFERGHTFIGDRVAIAWIPPDLALVTAADMRRGGDLIAKHAGDARAEETLGVVIQARGHAIEAPHWTLQYIGVRSSATGTGLGARAVQAGLAVVDRDGLPCGLISTNPRNLSFYQRHGFSIVAEVDAPGRAASLRPMLRPASPTTR